MRKPTKMENIAMMEYLMVVVFGTIAITTNPWFAFPTIMSLWAGERAEKEANR